MQEHMLEHTSASRRPDGASDPAAQQDAGQPGVRPGRATPLGGDASSGKDPTLREDDNAYAFGATTLEPQYGPGRTHLPLGPGNEAMEDGASPAPRGYTGGAMGRVVAGLSPNFSAAAEDVPAPGGNAIYTEAESATTFAPKAEQPSAAE